MNKRGTDSKLARQRFFDTTVHHLKVKECISGKNENRVILLLENMGYVLNKDFVRQHPIAHRFVLDFAFVEEQVAIEVDGKSHDCNKQSKKDEQRDLFLGYNNWVTIRIKDGDLFGFKGSFYKSLIREIVMERRKQWKDGRLYPIDFTNFEETL